jgi:hypothetical protein
MSQPKRILRGLRIDEVSSCTKGANPGARITLWKRAESNPHYAHFAKIFQKPKQKRDRLDYLTRYAGEDMTATGRHASLIKRSSDDDVDVLTDDDIDDINDDLGVDDNTSEGSTSHIDRLANLICEAQPGLDRSAAINWLLHTPVGQSLVVRTKKRRLTKRKEQTTMPETFAKMVADVGMRKPRRRDATACVSDH